MNKNSVKGYAILGILFALVSVVVFAVPTAKTPAFWIAYGFTVVAFAVQPFIWKLALGREKSLKSNSVRQLEKIELTSGMGKKIIRRLFFCRAVRILNE